MRLSKGSSNNATAVSVSVSADAVAEHARQTSMLLPGGLSVVGLFLFAPGGLSAAAGGESSLLSAWREAVRISDASGGCRLGGAGGGGGGGVLLGADASSRGRVAAKEVVSSSSSSSSSSSALSLRHAETRFAPLIPRLVSLRATYPVAAKVSVSAKEKKKKKKGGGQRAAPAPAPPPLLSDLLSAVAGAEKQIEGAAADLAKRAEAELKREAAAARGWVDSTVSGVEKAAGKLESEAEG